MPAISAPRRFVRPLAMAVLSAAVLGADCGSGGGVCPVTGSCLPDRPIAVIQGVVVDRDENPVADATVETSPPTASARTATDGRFSIEVPFPIDRYDLEVVARHETMGEATVRVTVTATNPTPEVRLELRGPADPPADPTPTEHLDLRVTVSDAVFPCVFEGEPIEFEVDVRNLGEATVEGAVVHDSLSSPEIFSRALEESDIVVNRERFPDAVVTVNPDGFSFSISLGTLASTVEASGDGYARAYSVSLPAGENRGVWCNRVVGRLANGTPFGEDVTCVTTTLAIMLDIVNEDGILRPDGTFDGTVEVFRVGDGGEGNRDGLLYRIEIRNGSCATLTDTRLVARLAPAGVVVYRGVADGSPSTGAVTDATDGRIVWEIGDLPFDESAVLLIRAEARAEGSAVHRVELSSPALPGVMIDEESTRVEP